MSSIALIGIEGAGKTAVGRMLERCSGIRIKHVQMGETASALIVSLFQTWLRLAIACFYQLRGFLVVCDGHCVFERLFPPERPTWADRAKTWMLGRSCARPDAFIYLDTPVETALSRKPGADEDRLRQTSVKLLERVRRESPVIRIDANRPLED